MGWYTWGGTDGTWVAANFGGTLPGAGDDVKFPANIAQAVTGSPSSLVLYNSLQTDKRCQVQLGTSGTPIKLASTEIDLAGTADAYIKNDGGGVSNVVARLIIRPSNYNAAVVMTSDDGDNGEYDNVFIHSGAVQIDSATGTMARVTVSELAPGSITSCVLSSGCGTLTNLVLESGAMEAQNVVTNAYVAPGAVLTKTTAALTNAWVSGTLYYNDDGDITLLVALPGSLIDFTQAPVTDSDGIDITTLVECQGSTIRWAKHVNAPTNHYRMG